MENVPSETRLTASSVSAAGSSDSCGVASFSNVLVAYVVDAVVAVFCSVVLRTTVGWTLAPPDSFELFVSEEDSVEVNVASKEPSLVVGK